MAMRKSRVLCFFIFMVLFAVIKVNAENPYRFFTWKITYGDIYPLGVKQQVLCFFHFYVFLWKVFAFLKLKVGVFIFCSSNPLLLAQWHLEKNEFGTYWWRFAGNLD